MSIDPILLFDFSAISNNGTIYSGKTSIVGLFNYDRVLGLAVAKSFPSGTFSFDVTKFEGERQLNGYLVF